MSSLVVKKKANQTYYYIVESARVDGKPRIVHQTYLGTAERLAAQRSGVFDLLLSLRPQPRSGPSTAHDLLLAAIYRICLPGPKPAVADWYRHTLLPVLWGFEPERFTSQAFWDCFAQIQCGGERDADELSMPAWARSPPCPGTRRRPNCARATRKSCPPVAAISRACGSPANRSWSTVKSISAC